MSLLKGEEMRPRAVWIPRLRGTSGSRARMGRRRGEAVRRARGWLRIKTEHTTLCLVAWRGEARNSGGQGAHGDAAVYTDMRACVMPYCMSVMPYWMCVESLRDARPHHGRSDDDSDISALERAVAGQYRAMRGQALFPASSVSSDDSPPHLTPDRPDRAAWPEKGAAPPPDTRRNRRQGDSSMTPGEGLETGGAGSVPCWPVTAVSVENLLEGGARVSGSETSDGDAWGAQGDGDGLLGSMEASMWTLSDADPGLAVPPPTREIRTRAGVAEGGRGAAEGWRLLRADSSEYEGLAYETSGQFLSVNASWEERHLGGLAGAAMLRRAQGRHQSNGTEVLEDGGEEGGEGGAAGEGGGWGEGSAGGGDREESLRAALERPSARVTEAPVVR